MSPYLVLLLSLKFLPARLAELPYGLFMMFRVVFRYTLFMMFRVVFRYTTS